VTFKPEITLGQITEILGLLVGVLVLARKFGGLEQKVDLMYEWWTNSVIYRGERREPLRGEHAKRS
jgi:hypothetical protein